MAPEAGDVQRSLADAVGCSGVRVLFDEPLDRLWVVSSCRCSTERHREQRSQSEVFPPCPGAGETSCTHHAAGRPARGELHPLQYWICDGKLTCDDELCRLCLFSSRLSPRRAHVSRLRLGQRWTRLPLFLSARFIDLRGSKGTAKTKRIDEEVRRPSLHSGGRAWG